MNLKGNGEKNRETGRRKCRFRMEHMIKWTERKERKEVGAKNEKEGIGEREERMAQKLK